MSKNVKQFEKVAALLVAANGAGVAVASLQAVEGIVPVRMSTYLWEVRAKLQGKIEAVKDGKTVTAYKLTNPETVQGLLDKLAASRADTVAAVKPAKVKAEKPAKVAKAPKAEKAPKAAKAPKAPAKVAEPAAAPKTARKPAGRAAHQVALGVANVQEIPLSAAAVDADFDAVGDHDLPAFLAD